MEAGAIAGLIAELRGVENRVDGIHNGLGAVRAETAKHEVAIQVLHTQLRNMGEDIAELKGFATLIIQGTG